MKIGFTDYRRSRFKSFEKGFPRDMSSFQDDLDASLPNGVSARAGERSGFQRSNRAIL